MDRSVQFLKDRITDKMPLEEMVGIFEQMCSTPVEEEMILFETGTFPFPGGPMFLISLVSQFPNGEEEFFQLHLNILYEPDEEEFFQLHLNILYEPDRESERFREAVWDEDIGENIFDYIRDSEAFAYAKKREYVKVEIYLDET
jgi:hypothetical protein